MHSDRRGNGQKAPRTKPSRQKTKPPDKNPREKLRENLYRELLSGFFVLSLLKIGGPRCVTYFWGVPGCVTKCNRAGSNWQKIALLLCEYSFYYIKASRQTATNNKRDVLYGRPRSLTLHIT